jgi:hypothetical protein
MTGTYERVFCWYQLDDNSLVDWWRVNCKNCNRVEFNRIKATWYRIVNPAPPTPKCDGKTDFNFKVTWANYTNSD